MESHGSGAAFFLMKKRARFVTAMPVGERNDLNKRLSLRQNYSQRIHLRESEQIPLRAPPRLDQRESTVEEIHGKLMG